MHNRETKKLNMEKEIRNDKKRGKYIWVYGEEKRKYKLLTYYNVTRHASSIINMVIVCVLPSLYSIMILYNLMWRSLIQAKSYRYLEYFANNITEKLEFWHRISKTRTTLY